MHNRNKREKPKGIICKLEEILAAIHDVYMLVIDSDRKAMKHGSFGYKVGQPKDK